MRTDKQRADLISTRYSSMHDKDYFTFLPEHDHLVIVQDWEDWGFTDADVAERVLKLLDTIAEERRQASPRT